MGSLMSIFTEGAYGMPAQMFPTELLLTKYPQLKISTNYAFNSYDYKIDDFVVFRVHFMQNSTFELYQNIEKAIEGYLHPTGHDNVGFGSPAYHTPNKKDPVIDHLTLRVTQLEKDMADVIQHLKSMSNVFLNGGHE